MVLEQLWSQLSVPATHSLISMFIKETLMSNTKGMLILTHKPTITLSSIPIESVSWYYAGAGVRSIGIVAIMLTVVHISGTFINIL
jgi:hypothetical protein